MKTFTQRPYPELSWSHSRDLLFQECQRKYYYQYYAAHNGWLRDAHPEAQTAYRLKQLSNLYLTFGDAIHQIAHMYIQMWQQKNHLYSASELHDKLRNLLNRAFLDSRDVEQWRVAPKRRTMLHEMYYYNHLPDKTVAVIKDRMNICMDHLLKSESLNELIHTPGHEIIEMEQLNDIYLDNIKIYVKLDLLYRHADGRFIIVDWKTGKEDERIEEQLHLYAYYLHHERHLPLDKIEIRTEYLLSGNCERTTVTEADLEQLEMKIYNSMDGMRDHLENVEQNQPKPAAEFTGTANTYICQTCNFREICDIRSA